VQYAASLSEGVLDIPSAARWRPKSAVSRQFRQLCLAAIRVAESRSKAVIDNQAAHGLEQQLLDALGRCLVGAPDFRETSVNHRDRVTLGRFDELLQSEAARETADLSAALGVSERKLRTCCRKHLGVNPSTYIRLLQMQLRQRLPEGFAGHV
jgi:AraC-like DNA-binding protein